MIKINIHHERHLSFNLTCNRKTFELADIRHYSYLSNRELRWRQRRQWRIAIGKRSTPTDRVAKPLRKAVDLVHFEMLVTTALCAGITCVCLLLIFFLKNGWMTNQMIRGKRNTQDVIRSSCTTATALYSAAKKIGLYDLLTFEISSCCAVHGNLSATLSLSV